MAQEGVRLALRYTVIRPTSKIFSSQANQKHSDEGHKIKNEQSQVAKALQGLSAEFRLILTGTPIQNDMTELWALLHWWVTIFHFNHYHLG